MASLRININEPLASFFFVSIDGQTNRPSGASRFQKEMAKSLGIPQVLPSCLEQVDQGSAFELHRERGLVTYLVACTAGCQLEGVSKKIAGGGGAAGTFARIFYLF